MAHLPFLDAPDFWPEPSGPGKRALDILFWLGKYRAKYQELHSRKWACV